MKFCNILIERALFESEENIFSKHLFSLTYIPSDLKFGVMNLFATFSCPHPLQKANFSTSPKSLTGQVLHSCFSLHCQTPLFPLSIKNTAKQNPKHYSSAIKTLGFFETTKNEGRVGVLQMHLMTPTPEWNPSSRGCPGPEELSFETTNSVKGKYIFGMTLDMYCVISSACFFQPWFVKMVLLLKSPGENHFPKKKAPAVPPYTHSLGGLNSGLDWCFLWCDLYQVDLCETSRPFVFAAWSFNWFGSPRDQLENQSFNSQSMSLLNSAVHSDGNETGEMRQGALGGIYQFQILIVRFQIHNALFEDHGIALTLCCVGRIINCMFQHVLSRLISSSSNSCFQQNV